MHRILLSALLTLTAVASIQAQTRVPVDEVRGFDTQRVFEMATLRLRLYQQVEHPAEVRHLASAIRLTEAEIDAYRHRLRQYRPFTKFETGSPLAVTIERLKLDLLAAELRLADYRAELAAKQRFHGDRVRLLMLEVEQAAANRRIGQ